MGECPTCGDDDSDVEGTRTWQRIRFLTRAHFALHKARIALAEDSRALADELSALIRHLEDIMSADVRKPRQH